MGPALCEIFVALQKLTPANLIIGDMLKCSMRVFVTQGLKKDFHDSMFLIESIRNA